MNCHVNKTHRNHCKHNNEHPLLVVAVVTLKPPSAYTPSLFYIPAVVLSNNMLETLYQ